MVFCCAQIASAAAARLQRSAKAARVDVVRVASDILGCSELLSTSGRCRSMCPVYICRDAHHSDVLDVMDASVCQHDPMHVTTLEAPACTVLTATN